MCKYVISVIYELKYNFRACVTTEVRKANKADASAHQICVECGSLKLHEGNGMCS
jgi:hypothetical protein